MSTKVASLYADIGAKTDSFEKGAKKVKDELKGSVLPSLEKARVKTTDWIGANAGLLSVVVPALAAVGTALKYSVDQATEAEMANAKLNAVLQSTSFAAGMTANELDAMAMNLSRLSTYDDEAIKGSEALLLTFTSIGREVFPEAQQAILDMSVAMGQDLKSSTVQLGRALQDPILGMTALRRVGVNFNKEQQELVKTMVESGDVMGAQKYILKELSVEFGGQALAASKTYAGQTQQLKNELGNLGEAIGEDLLPSLLDLTTSLKDFVIWVNENKVAVEKWTKVLSWAASPMAQTTLLIKDKIKAGKEDNEVTDDAVDSTENLGGAFIDLGGSLGDLTEQTKEQEDALKALTDANKGFLSLVENIQSAEDSYHGNAKKLNEERIKIEGERAAAIAAGWWESSDKIKDYDAALAENTQQVLANEEEHKRANLEIISGLVERKLMQDGVLDDAEFEWLLQKRQEWGLYSADVVAKARAAWKEADKITASIANIPSNKTSTITVLTVTQNASGANINGQQYNYKGRAEGGWVNAGQTYMVGERGPEKFTAAQSGMITPNNQLSQGFDYNKLGRVIVESLMQSGG